MTFLAFFWAQDIPMKFNNNTMWLQTISNEIVLHIETLTNFHMIQNREIQSKLIAYFYQNPDLI